jgi:putative N6-adenine-specific DNA methylase
MYTWHISTAFGLESVVGSELKALGLESEGIGNGTVQVKGDATALARMQLWLRCAERISLVVDIFRARDFDDLFDNLINIPWEEILPWDARILIVCPVAANATITSARSSQAIAKKAIIERLKRGTGRRVFPETGDPFSITIDISAETATVLLDACGDGLHRRGYRIEPGVAPVRETTAAAMVLLSGWVRLPSADGSVRKAGSMESGEILWDPCCGSGTIAIEAAMLAADIAPGLMRYFASESWSFLDKTIFEGERAKAKERALAGIERPAPTIRASDLDPQSISITDGNMQRAGVAGRIKLFKADVREMADPGEEAIILANPPYGERLGDDEEAAQIAAEMFGRMRTFRKPWRCGMLTPNREINDVVGMRYRKNRKLYNGKICVWLCWFDSQDADVETEKKQD